jgi:hypothetical protein
MQLGNAAVYHNHKRRLWILGAQTANDVRHLVLQEIGLHLEMQVLHRELK